MYATNALRPCSWSHETKGQATTELPRREVNQSQRRHMLIALTVTF